MEVKVQDSRYVRDTNSMALINKDYAARDEYYAKLRMVSQQKSEINTIKAEVSSVKNDIQDIKKMLELLMDKGRNG